jgi:hypothetical protein
MSLRWPDDPAWNALMTPISPLLERALARLEVEFDLEWGDADGAVRSERRIVLDRRLLAASPWHPVDAAWREAAEDAAPLAIDRWRRAAGAILAAANEGSEGPEWWRRGVAVEAADHAAPELGLLWPALADWYRAPETGADTAEKAAWFVRWRRLEGQTRWAAPTEAEWMAFGAWLFSRAADDAPLPIRPAVRRPGGWTAAPLSFRRIRVEAGAAGARLEARGCVCPPARFAAGQAGVVLVGALDGASCDLLVAPLGPVGRWAVRTGRSGERFGAARNMELTLWADGRGEVTLADAFVGPATAEALSLADQFGVSGTLMGRWKVVDTEGPVIEISGLVPQGITVHPRGRFGFAVPAGPFLGRAEGWLRRAEGSRWRLRPYEAGFEALGDDAGRQVALVFAPADPVRDSRS